LAVLLSVLEREADSDVLHAVGIALGHLGDPRAVEPLVRFKNHPSSDVRYGVVFGLLSHEDELAIRTLIELSSDVYYHVRDWATFGLGTQIDANTEEI
jgi:HEAT repeat protein